MTPALTLAVFAAPDAGTSAVAEWLRVVAALVACGENPVLAVLPGCELDPEALTSDAARTLETLSDLGVVPRAVGAATLVQAASAACRIVCIGPPDRGDDVFVIDDAALSAARRDPAAFLTHLTTAGQVIRF